MRNVILSALLTGAAFTSISHVASAQTTPIKTSLFANGLSAPIYLTAPANDFDHVYVVERAGRIKCLDAKTGAVLSTFLDISGLTTTAGERGLLSMAFHPQYDINGANKKFYLYYTNTSGNIVIAKYEANTALSANTVGQILITINHPTFSNHNGGQVRFGSDGYLYFATGDGGSGNDPNNNASNINSDLGKLHRIDVDTTTGSLPYGIPATNPYASVGTGNKNIFSIGLRNPFRFSFDRNVGNLYIGDVGQNAYEEVDFQSATYVPTPGTPRHYGWRCYEGVHATNLAGCTYPTPYPGFPVIFPIHEYAHSPNPNGPASITGGVVYRGCALPDWRGTYFFAEEVLNKIWTFKYVGAANPPVTERTAQLAPGGGLSITSIVAFGEDATGEVYICDLGGGEIFKIVPQSPPVIVGVASYGTGTAGCSGSQAMGVNSSPCVNNPIFQLTTTNCPPSSLGLCVITDQQDVVGSDPFGLGVLFHVGFGGGTVLGYDAFSDASGNGGTPAAISNDPNLGGLTFYVQTLWAWTSCTLPGFNPYNLSTSNALALTVQP